jgi:hypothetical protein
MVASLVQARIDLGPYVQRLARCVQLAIAEFLKDQGKFIAKMETRTQAGILRDYIVAEIRSEFPEDEPGIHHTTRSNLYLLSIHNLYFLRFKKLDRRLRTRNNPTQMSLDYLLQRPLELFPDLEPATHLNLGYRPGLTIATSSIWITCPDGNALEWEWGLSEAEEPAQLTPVAPTERRVRRVRPRRLDIEKAGDGSVG